MTAVEAGSWDIVFLAPSEHRRPLGNEAISYLDDGTQVLASWRGRDGFSVACDAERLDTCVRPLIVCRYDFPSDAYGFAERWTRAEVYAKLTDTPILLRLRDLDIPDEIHVETHCFLEQRVVVTLGLRGHVDAIRSEALLQTEKLQRREFRGADDENTDVPERMP